VGPSETVARRVARALSSRFPRTRLLGMTVASYLGRPGVPLPLVLAPAGRDADADRRFLEAARDRILWPLPPAEIYDAISGVLTDLPALTGRRSSSPGSITGVLLLEGKVTAARARAALDSPVRSWVVEHAGCVRISDRALGSLQSAGVRWSALRPPTLLGVVDPTRCARPLFPPGTRVWRAPRTAI
jgi:hypothetical protein